MADCCAAYGGVKDVSFTVALRFAKVRTHEHLKAFRLRLPVSNAGPQAIRDSRGRRELLLHAASGSRSELTKMSQQPDPYLKPAFSLGNRLARGLWGIVYVLLFRPSPRPLHAWRTFLLRCFGAKLGKHCHIYPKARIWAPWNLQCEDQATIAEESIIYNPDKITLGSHTIVSQQAYLCGATHDYEDPKFPLISLPITIGSYAWICARATVQSGLSVGEGAVLGLGSVATHDLDAWTVYAGVPAHKLKMRVFRDSDGSGPRLREISLTNLL